MNITITLDGCHAGQDSYDFVASAISDGKLPSNPKAIDHDAPFVHCHFSAQNITEVAKLYPENRVMAMVRNTGELGDGGRIEQARMIRVSAAEWRNELYRNWFVSPTACAKLFGPDVLARLMIGEVVVL